MRDLGKPYLVKMLVVAMSLGGCSTVDFSQPEIPLPARFSEGADIRLTSFEGFSGFDSPAEGPSLSILRDQLAYGTVRCSRRGPILNLEISANFTERKEVGRSPDRLLGVATWRDPASRQLVGRHHIDIDVFFDGDYRHLSVSSDQEGLGSSVPGGQLRAGEVFVARVCEKAFGWSGLPG